MSGGVKIVASPINITYVNFLNLFTNVNLLPDTSKKQKKVANN